MLAFITTPCLIPWHCSLHKLDVFVQILYLFHEGQAPDKYSSPQKVQLKNLNFRISKSAREFTSFASFTLNTSPYKIL